MTAHHAYSLEDWAEFARVWLGKGVDNGSDEQLNKAPAMNGNESTGKRTDAPFLVLSPPHDQILSHWAREKREG
jgi:hypothetical protein